MHTNKNTFRETRMKKSTLLLAAGLTIAFTYSASAQTRVTYKSAKSTSSYYQMAVQLAEAMKKGSNGDIILTVEEIGRASCRERVAAPG